MTKLTETLRAHLFARIDFLGIQRNVFLKVVQIEETKVKIHKWPSNNLSFDGK